jgi:hypothetical protein
LLCSIMVLTPKLFKNYVDDDPVINQPDRHLPIYSHSMQRGY